MFKNNKKTINLFEKTVNERKRIHDELVKKELDNLNKIVKSEKYNIDAMITKSSLGNVYHDLIDSKDQINSEYQTRYNQTYHFVDIELRKMNKRLDNTTKMINYNYNNKKENLKNKMYSKIVG